MSKSIKIPIFSLGDLAEKIDYGLTASAKEADKGTKFLRITDIQDDKVDWSTVPYCDCSSEDKNKYALAPGDIVFARTGATTGKSFLIRNCPPGSVFASYLIRVRPSERIDSGYLARFFQTQNYWQQIIRSTTGTAQGGVNSTKLKQLSVPLPPIEEQKRIAAILDKADEVRRKRQEAIALTEELARSHFLHLFGDPVTNPKGWDIRELSELLSIVSGQVDPQSKPYIDMPHIGGENIESNTGNLSGIQTPRELLLKSGKYLFKPNDVLYSKIRPYLNKVVMPEFTGVCSADIYPLRVDESKLNQNYLVYLLRSKSFLDYAEKHSTRTNIPKINRPTLLNFTFPYPPIKLQNEFSIVCNKVRHMKNKIKERTVDTENLFNSLLQRAFKGEL